MSNFKSVNIKKEANIYFDGKVTSRSIEFEDGVEKSLGIMHQGEYRFNTEAAEIMDIYSGDIEIKLEGKDKFTKLRGPSRFEVPKNSYFDIKVNSLTDYCCTYIN